MARDDRQDQERFRAELNGVGGGDDASDERGPSPRRADSAPRTAARPRTPATRTARRLPSPTNDLLRRQRDQQTGEQRRVAVANSTHTSRYTRTDRQAHRRGVHREGSPVTHAEEAIGEAQHMRIGVRLLVVLAARALQPSVLDAAVVADLCQPQVRQVLADALVDLLVVEDAVRSWRDEQRQRRRRGPRQPPSGPTSRRVDVVRHASSQMRCR